MKKKIKQEKQVKKPKLYLFYVIYWMCAGICFFTTCVYGLRRLKIMGGLPDINNYHILSVCIFWAITILWLITLLWFIWYKKEKFYRKWLGKTLLGFFLLFSFLFGVQYLAYLNREKIPESLYERCFDCHPIFE